MFEVLSLELLTNSSIKRWIPEIERRSCGTFSCELLMLMKITQELNDCRTYNINCTRFPFVF